MCACVSSFIAAPIFSVVVSLSLHLSTARRHPHPIFLSPTTATTATSTYSTTTTTSLLPYLTFHLNLTTLPLPYHPRSLRERPFPPLSARAGLFSASEFVPIVDHHSCLPCPWCGFVCLHPYLTAYYTQLDSTCPAPILLPSTYLPTETQLDTRPVFPLLERHLFFHRLSLYGSILLYSFLPTISSSLHSSTEKPPKQPLYRDCNPKPKTKTKNNTKRYYYPLTSPPESRTCDCDFPTMPDAARHDVEDPVSRSWPSSSFFISFPHVPPPC